MEQYGSLPVTIITDRLIEDPKYTCYPIPWNGEKGLYVRMDCFYHTPSLNPERNPNLPSSLRNVMEYLIGRWPDYTPPNACPLKNVEITFVCNGLFYRMYPGSIGTSEHLFDAREREIKDLLIKAGCVFVRYHGMMD